MEVSNWLALHWFDLLQTVGIVGGLLFTTLTIRKDERARRIGNSIEINRQHREIWQELYVHPHLARVLEKNVDLSQQPVSIQEEFFISSLILHLSTVYRAMRFNEFVSYDGMQRDVKGFFNLPIPSTVWRNSKIFQDADFVNYVEDCLEQIQS